MTALPSLRWTKRKMDDQRIMGYSSALRVVIFEKFATFSGRASRSEYWCYMGLYCLMILGIIAAIGLATRTSTADGVEISPLGLDIGLFVGFIVFVISVPLVSVQVRRFHDRNLSGWWYLGLAVLSLVPLFGYLASISILAMSTMKGTVGPNRFGPDPVPNALPVQVFE